MRGSGVASPLPPHQRHSLCSFSTSGLEIIIGFITFFFFRGLTPVRTSQRSGQSSADTRIEGPSEPRERDALWREGAVHGTSEWLPLREHAPHATVHCLHLGTTAQSNIDIKKKYQRSLPLHHID